MISRALYSSRTDEWETPQDVFDKLNEEFHFTLDVAANEQNHKCERYYTREQDGLQQDWSGETVWCNPPYGREIGKWVQKAYETVVRGGGYSGTAGSLQNGHEVVSRLGLREGRD